MVAMARDVPVPPTRMRPARVGTDLGVEPTQARGHLSGPARALHRARRPLGVVGVALGLCAGRFAVQVVQGIRLLGYPRQDRSTGFPDHQGWTDRDGVPGRMTSAPQPHRCPDVRDEEDA